MLALPDILILLIMLTFGTLLRLPLHVLGYVRFEQGQPLGDLSGVETKISYQRGSLWIRTRVGDSLNGEIFGYPMFFHWLVSRFRRVTRPAAVALNILPDVVFAVLIYWLVLREAEAQAAPDARLWASLSTIAFLTMPILLPVTARMSATNGRSFGMLLALGALAAAWAVIETGNWLWFALSVLLSILTILTSLFGMQVLVFFAFAVSLALMSPLPLAAVAAGFLIGAVTPGLGVREVLVFKYNHSLWYRRNKLDAALGIGERTLFQGLLALPREIFAAPAKAFRRLLQHLPLAIAVYSAPLLVVLAVQLFDPANWALLRDDPFLRFNAGILLGAVIAFFLTSTRWLLEFGQGERYFEYAAPSLVIVATALALRNGGMDTLVLLMICCIQLATLVLMHVFGALPVRRLVLHLPSQRSESEVLEFLRKLPGEPHVACLPQQIQRYWSGHTYKWSDTRIRYFSLWMLKSLKDKGGFRELDEIFGAWIKVPKIAPGELRARHDISHVIALRKFLQSAAKRNAFARELQDSWKPVFENEKYVVFDLSATGPSASP